MSALILVLAASVALAAEWTARAPEVTRIGASRSAPADLDSFLSPMRHDRGNSAYDGLLRIDPLADRQPGVGGQTVAPAGGVPTVSSSQRRGRRLTAILISDDHRSVAVIDDAVVSVGDRLADGARVDAIRSDRVSVVERNGRMRVLTLTAGRQ